MAERARIARFFAPLSSGEPGSFTLTDDAAILVPPPGQSLVITTDSVIEGLHVLAGATPQQYAQKLMRRNLSDLAAMGASPWRYSLNLHTPPTLRDNWFADFAAALAHEQTQFGLTLIGGDSTSGAGAIHAGMTCLGLIEGQPLRRSGARAGEDVYVSGTLGDAALALTLLQQNQPVEAVLAARYHAPTPRLALGKMLRSMASAAIDISDGLLADLEQLCAASGVGATLARDSVPLSDAMRDALTRDAACWRYPLSGGDDYELLFTAPKTQRDALAALAQQLALPLTRIGEVVATPGITLHDAQGAPLAVQHKGWEH